MLENYETGVLTAEVKLNKKWYQFWLPKYSVMDVGAYTRIGALVDMDIKIGTLYLNGHSTKEGSFVGKINGLPGVLDE